MLPHHPSPAALFSFDEELEQADRFSGRKARLRYAVADLEPTNDAGFLDMESFTQSKNYDDFIRSTLLDLVDARRVTEVGALEEAPRAIFREREEDPGSDSSMDVDETPEARGTRRFLRKVKEGPLPGGRSEVRAGKFRYKSTREVTILQDGVKETYIPAYCINAACFNVFVIGVQVDTRRFSMFDFAITCYPCKTCYEYFYNPRKLRETSWFTANAYM